MTRVESLALVFTPLLLLAQRCLATDATLKINSAQVHAIAGVQFLAVEQACWLRSLIK
jgi:hypothetical protein